MVESAATIKLRAVDTNVVSTVNGISTASTNALLGATALAGGFKLLEKASKTSVAQMAIGANNADKLTSSFGKLSVASNGVTKALSKISSGAFVAQQLAVLADGVGKAAEQYARIPQAMQAMQASGVSTYSVQQFNNLTEAVKGSDIALDSLLTSSIAELGEFEKAAARAGTILKSSLRFDDRGNALTANSKERLDNALSVQKLVNEELNNSVTSTEALRGQYEVLSSGFTDQVESQEVLLQGAKLIGIGKAGGQSVNPTATLQLLTKSLNAYGYEANDAAKVSAKLNAIVENGLTTIPELGAGFGKMAAQASKANIALEDSGAGVAVLTSQGISTAEAMSGIARLSASIISKTPEAEKELAKLELRGEKIRFDKAEIQAKGLTQALIDLNDATGGSSALLAKILPEDVAFRTANALLAQNGKTLSDTKRKLVEADEAKLNEIFEVAQSDRTARFVRLANRFRESIIEIGLSLAPVLEPGIKALETIANKFAGLPEPVRKALGAYLAFRLQSKAVGSAANVLIKTLVGLATNYLMVRVVSLALTGQLGKEAKAIKDLVLQKKGLAAATFQAFGIDQKWRLEQSAATEAIKQQSKAAKLATAVKATAAKVTKAAGGVAASGVAATSGITKKQAKEELFRRKAQAEAIARQAATRGKDFAQKVSNKFNEKLDQHGIKIPTIPTVGTGAAKAAAATQAAQAASLITPPPKAVAGLLPPAGYAQAAAAAQAAQTSQAAAAQAASSYVRPPIITPPPAEYAQPKGGGIVQGRYIPGPGSDRTAGTANTPIGLLSGDRYQRRIEQIPDVPITTDQQRALDSLVARDAGVQKASAQYLKDSKAHDKIFEDKDRVREGIEKAQQQRDKASLALNKERAKAMTATTNQVGALNKVKKKQEALTRATNAVHLKELELTNLHTKGMYTKNRVSQAQAKLKEAELAATKKLTPLSKAIADNKKAQTVATKADTAAKMASVQADQLEATLGAKNAATIKAKAAARAAETLATTTQTAASQAAATVTAIETKLTEKQTLAEMGLYKVRMFGSTHTLRSVGLIGKINKILTTNIALTKIATLAEIGYGKAKGTMVAITNIKNYQIGVEQAKLALLNAKSAGGKLMKVLLGSTKKAGGAIKGLLAPLGALAPLLGVGAFAAIALRSEIFGLGKEARKFSKQYKEIIKDQAKLQANIEKKKGLTALEGLIDGSDFQYQPDIKIQPKLTVDRGVSNAVVTATQNAVEATAKGGGAVVKSPVKLGKVAIDGAGNLIFGDGNQTLSSNSKVAQQLQSLKDSGAITTNEFNRLAIAFNKTGDGSKEAVKGLSDLRAEIKKIKGGAQEVEKGVVENITSTIKKLPGFVGKTVDFGINSLVSSLNYTSRESVKLDREADKLISTFSEIGNLRANAGDQFLETAIAIKDYRTELALTSTVQEKVAGGYKLTQADLNNEEQAFKARADANRFQVQALEKTINSAREMLDSVETEENKAILQKQIDDTLAQKEALEKQGEAYKKLREEIKKYLETTLPAIQTALKENADPGLALKNAQEKFDQAYLTDSEGRVTKLLKPIETLRDEGGKLIGQIEENLSLGLLDGEGGESAAAEQMRKVRDDIITFMQDGVETEGTRFSLGQRRDLTKQIVALDNADINRQQQQNKVRLELDKHYSNAKLQSESATNIKLAKNQYHFITANIAQKEQEIEELRKLNLRTIDEELELEKLKIQQKASLHSVENAQYQQLYKRNQLKIGLEQALGQAKIQSASDTNVKVAIIQEQTLSTQIRQLEKQIERGKALELDNFENEQELAKLKVQQKASFYKIQLANHERFLKNERQLDQQFELQGRQINDQSKDAIADLTKQNKLTSFDLTLTKQRQDLQSKYAQLAAGISKNEVYNAANRAKLSKVQLDNLKENLPLERSQLENQIAITKEKQKQQIINSKIAISKAQTNLVDAQDRLELAKVNGLNEEEIKNLQIQVGNRELGLKQAVRANELAEFEYNNSEKLAENKRTQLETGKKLEAQQLRTRESNAKLAEVNAQLTRDYNQQNQALKNRTQSIQLAAKEQSQNLAAQTGGLSLVQKITNSEKVKLKIAQKLSELKLNSLRTQLASEASILSINQQQARLQLKASKDKTDAALQQNKADLLKTEANIEQLEATGASQAEIDAERAQLNANYAQRQVLFNQRSQQEQQTQFLEHSQRLERESFRTSSNLRVDNARVDALANLPEKEREKARKALFKEFASEFNLESVKPNLRGAISNLRDFNIKVPELKIPKLEFPSLEDIKADVRSIVSEFRVNKPSPTGGLNVAEGEGRNWVIQNLQMESPINISIDGAQDTDQVAQEVEATVFNAMTNALSGIEAELNTR